MPWSDYLPPFSQLSPFSAPCRPAGQSAGTSGDKPLRVGGSGELPEVVALGEAAKGKKGSNASDNASGKGRGNSGNGNGSGTSNR